MKYLKIESGKEEIEFQEIDENTILVTILDEFTNLIITLDREQINQLKKFAFEL